MRDNISSESTLERGLAPLPSIRDALPKALVARARHEPYTPGCARAGSREMAARRAWVLSVALGYRATGHAAPFAPARETPSPYRRPVVSDWPFAKRAYRVRTRRSRQ